MVVSLGSTQAFADLQAKLITYASELEKLCSPNNVLDELHAITSTSLQLFVFGAARFPKKSTDWGSIKLGNSAFLHNDVPTGLWEEYIAIAQQEFDPGIILARSSLAAFTWTEFKRMCQPIGIDRWTDDLALKYGMRDGLTCPVGGRWVVVFWAKRDLSKILTVPMRIMIFAATSFAALRLEQLVGPDSHRLASRESLTPRETAVWFTILRLYGATEPWFDKTWRPGEITLVN